MKRLLIFVLLAMFCAAPVAADTLTIVEDGTYLISDSYIAGFVFDRKKNYGTSASLIVKYDATSWYRSFIKVNDPRHLIGPGANITTGVLKVKCSNNTTNGYVQLYTCHKPWTQGAVTWNKFDMATNWGIAGCDSSASSCPDNASADSCDYDSDAIDSVRVTTVGAWYSFALDTAYLNAQYKDDSVWNFVLISRTSGNNQFYSGDAAFGERPIFEISYTVSDDTTNGVDTLFSHRGEIMDAQFVDYDSIVNDIGEGNLDTLVDIRRKNWGNNSSCYIGQITYNGMVRPYSMWAKIQNIPDTTFDSAFFFVSQSYEQTADDGNLKFYRVLTGPAHEGKQSGFSYPTDTGMTWEHAWAIGDTTLDDSLVWDIPNHYTVTDSFLLSMTGNTAVGYANHLKSDDFKNLVQFWSDNPDSNFGMYVVFDDFGLDSAKQIRGSENGTETGQPFVVLYWSATVTATGQIIIIGEAVTEQRNKFTRRKCLPFGSL